MTRRVLQAVPSTTGRPGDLARMIARLLGPAWQAADGTVNAAQFVAEGDTLDAVLDTLDSAAAQCIPSEATTALEDWERVLYLPLDPLATDAERQAQTLAATRGTLSGAPEDLLAAIQTVVPGASIRERTTTDATALGSAREVFRVRVALGSSYGDAEIEGRVGALLRAALPAHATYDLGAYEYDELVTEASEELVTESSEVLTVEA